MNSSTPSDAKPESSPNANLNSTPNSTSGSTSGFSGNASGARASAGNHGTSSHDTSAGPASGNSGTSGGDARGPQEILQGIEQKVRESLLKIEDWSAEPHRFLAEERPKSLLASLAIGGFITGMMLRRDIKARQSQSAGEAESLRPLLSLLAGAVSGFVFGAQILNEAKRNGASLTIMGKPAGQSGATSDPTSAPAPAPKLGTLRSS